jgi:hypothetical protein
VSIIVAHRSPEAKHSPVWVWKFGLLVSVHISCTTSTLHILTAGRYPLCKSDDELTFGIP